MLVSNFAERLQEAIKYKNIKPAEIVRISEKLFNDGKINKALNKPIISHYLKGTYEAKQDNVYALSLILNVDEAWLMGYDVPMKKKNTNPDFSSLSIEKKDSAVVFVYGTIPAGIPMEMIEDILDTEEISADMLKGGKQYFGLKIKGDSMYPEYREGDIIICEKVDDCESGDECVVMINGNDATFKKVIKTENGIILQPLNPEYQPMVYSNEDIKKLPIRIIGKEIEMRRKK